MLCIRTAGATLVGAALTLGHGTLMPISAKQKLVTRSSTKAELVAVDDAMTFVMWAKNFLEWQARDLSDDSKMKHVGKNVIIEQDNTSARIKKEDMSVVHKATDLMLIPETQRNTNGAQ